MAYIGLFIECYMTGCVKYDDYEYVWGVSWAESIKRKLMVMCRSRSGLIDRDNFWYLVRAHAGFNFDLIFLFCFLPPLLLCVIIFERFSETNYLIQYYYISVEHSQYPFWSLASAQLRGRRLLFLLSFSKSSSYPLFVFSFAFVHFIFQWLFLLWIPPSTTRFIYINESFSIMTAFWKT